MLRGRFSKPRRHHCRLTECSVRPTIGGVKKLLSWKRPVAGRARLSSARRVVAWVYGGALRTDAPYLPASNLFLCLCVSSFFEVRPSESPPRTEEENSF